MSMLIGTDVLLSTAAGHAIARTRGRWAALRATAARTAQHSTAAATATAAAQI